MGEEERREGAADLASGRENEVGEVVGAEERRSLGEGRLAEERRRVREAREGSRRASRAGLEAGTRRQAEEGEAQPRRSTTSVCLFSFPPSRRAA